MGVVNVTPDSFSDGGVRLDPERAIADALQMVADGADLLDIGGESTRPGAPPVTADEEWRRVAPLLEGLSGRVDVPLSIDTYRAATARRALRAGVSIVNDISGLTYDPELPDIVARSGAALVLMHMRGRPQTMYAKADYEDVVGEVIDELRERRHAATRAGIAPDRLIFDPGLGFAKQAVHSLTLIAGFSRLHALEGPLLSGPSRKSFLTAGMGTVPPAARIWSTAAAVAASVLSGAHIVRVHDVREMGEVVRAADAIAAAPDASG